MPTRSSELKIVWWIDHLGPGGSQRILTRLVEHMAQQGAKQTVICFNAAPDNELTNRLSLPGVEVYVIGKKRLLLGFGLLPLWNIIRHGVYDVSVTFLFYADVVGTLVSWFCSVPTRISSQRSSNNHYSIFHLAIIRFALKKATCVVLNSSSYQAYAGRFLSDRAPVYVIPNGVNISRFSPLGNKSQFHQMFKVHQDTHFLGCIGRLSSEKAVEDVICALAFLASKRVHLILAGDGPQRPYLSEVSASLGLTGRVHFLGNRQDIPEVLRGLSLFIQASTFEGMPNSLMEAMAVGCPVAVSGIDVNLALVGKSKRGWIFPPGDVRALANTISTVLDHPKQARSCTNLAREYISQRFPEQQMLKSWQTLLEADNNARKILRN